MINSYDFVDILSDKLPSDAIVVVDTGTSFTCAFQAAKMKHGQRWVSAPGHSSMGYAIPGAIGAAFASGRNVVAIIGDGAFQFNVQELSTIRHHNLPITIFVLNNGGYLTIAHMQANHFSREVGCNPKSGLSFPSTMAIAGAYDIAHVCMTYRDRLILELDRLLDYGGPVVCEIMMPPNQPLIPRVSSLKRPDGSIASKPLEDMFPFLDREEFKANMIVKAAEVLE